MRAVEVEAKVIGGSVIRALVADMPVVVRQSVHIRMQRVCRELSRTVRAERLSGQDLKKRTGTLSRAVFERVEDAGDDVFGVVGVDLAKAPHGRVQDLGGRIVPKRARNLTIPLDAALTGNGVKKFGARDVIADPVRYGYDGTFTKGDVIFGTQARKRGMKLVPLFKLSKAVVIRPVGYMTKTVEQKREYVVSEIRLGAAEGLRKLKVTTEGSGRL